MPLQIIRQDIAQVCAQLKPDAAADTVRAADGQEAVRVLCETVRSGTEAADGSCPPPRYILHVCVPARNGASYREAQPADWYTACLDAAAEKGCESVALPLFGSCDDGFPGHPAPDAAVRALTAYLDGHEMTVYLCVPGREAFALPQELYDDVRAFVGRTYRDDSPAADEACKEEAEAPKKPRSPLKRLFKASFGRNADLASGEMMQSAKQSGAMQMNQAAMPTSAMPSEPRADAAEGTADLRESLTRRISRMDKSFSEMLLHLIDERGMTDVECYKRANVSRKTFSKIRCDPDYRPSKETAIAFAIALKLDLRETEAFLRTAGITLSHSVKFDVIIEYFISHGIYDLMQINEILFEFDQATLGC